MAPTTHGRCFMDQSDCPVHVGELLEIMDHDMELLRECLDDFARDAPDMLGQIRSAVAGGNHEALEYSAHAIKGTLRYLAAFKAADMALELEEAGRSNFSMDLAHDLLDRLENECGRIFRFIERFSV